MTNRREDFFITLHCYLPKAMKSFKAYLGAWILLGSILLLSACGGNELDIPDQPLEGTINGEAWKYGSANAFRLSADGLFQARFLSDREPVIDPCTRPFPGLVLGRDAPILLTMSYHSRMVVACSFAEHFVARRRGSRAPVRVHRPQAARSAWSDR